MGVQLPGFFSLGSPSGAQEFSPRLIPAVGGKVHAGSSPGRGERRGPPSGPILLRGNSGGNKIIPIIPKIPNLPRKPNLPKEPKRPYPSQVATGVLACPRTSCFAQHGSVSGCLPFLIYACRQPALVLLRCGPWLLNLRFPGSPGPCSRTSRHWLLTGIRRQLANEPV